jgi:hypothetical protein
MPLELLRCRIPANPRREAAFLFPSLQQSSIVNRRNV